MVRFVLLALLVPGLAQAAEVRVLTAGAYKAVLLALQPAFEKETGHTLVIRNETAGGVQQAVRDGAALDVVVLPPVNAQALGALVGAAVPLAKVGIGVAVRDGAAKPDISTVEGVRAAVLAARAPAWIDPAAGGSSGIYLSRLWERWGIAAQLAPKAVLVKGGLVADKIASGEADLAFQQMSELVGAPGTVVLGPLPAEIQSYTIYAGAVPATSERGEAARQLLAYLAGPASAGPLQARGMVAP